MKKIIFLFLFATYFINAQTQRFIYEYKFAPKKEKPDSLVTELMALDIDAKGSIYQSLAKIRYDSIFKVQFDLVRSGMSNQINMKGQFVKVRYVVQKDYPDYKTYLITMVGRDRYKVSSDLRQNWKILPDKQKVGEYMAQKATTTWGGREWTAWFSTDLPFQDGPYKFSGLPGLIVKMEDSTKTHTMTLAANKKIAGNDIDNARKNNLFILVNEERFHKAVKDYEQDPGREIRQMTDTKILDESGKPLDASELARKAQQNAKKRAKNYDNPIELF